MAFVYMLIGFILGMIFLVVALVVHAYDLSDERMPKVLKPLGWLIRLLLK